MSTTHGKHEQSLEAGLLTSTPTALDEKSALGTNPGSHQRSARRSGSPLIERMPPARQLVFTFVVCFLVTFSLASVIGPRVRPYANGGHPAGPRTAVALPPKDGDSGFADSQPDMLHRLLHAYFPDRYRHGAYPSDTKALESVQVNDAALANTLAKLAKRQDNNTTTTDTSVTNVPTTTPPPPPPPTTTTDNPPPPPPTTTTNNPPPPPPPPPPTSDSQSQIVTTPPPPPPPDTTTQAPPPNSATSPPGNPAGTSVEQQPPPSNTPPIDSVDSVPPPAPTSLPPTTLFTSASSLRITSNIGTTTTPATSKPSPIVSESFATLTSTDKNGNIVLVTSTSYYTVNPTPVESNVSSRPSAGLQNAAPRLQGGVALTVLVGVFSGCLLIVMAL